MFTYDQENYLEVSLETTRYLGKEEIARKFVNLLQETKIFNPQFWNALGERKKEFDYISQEEVIKIFCKNTESKYISFFGITPVQFEANINIEKYSKATFNNFSLYIKETILDIKNGQQMLLDFSIKLATIFNVTYGFITHTKQEKKQSPPYTLEERLPGVFWVNFFGNPYIEFFGQNKIINCSLYETKKIENNLLMIFLEENIIDTLRPEFESKIEKVKNYLGKKAFATENFPVETCLVPVFDFSELRNEKDSEIIQPLTLYKKFDKMGYSLRKDDQNEILFQNEEGSIVVFNKKEKLIRFFENSEIMDEIYKQKLA